VVAFLFRSRRAIRSITPYAFGIAVWFRYYPSRYAPSPAFGTPSVRLASLANKYFNSIVSELFAI
jgi:hypothetical protein